jgi:hypothetical protein
LKVRFYYRGLFFGKNWGGKIIRPTYISQIDMLVNWDELVENKYYLATAFLKENAVFFTFI